MQQARSDVAAPKKIKISLLGPACICKILILLWKFVIYCKYINLLEMKISMKCFIFSPYIATKYRKMKNENRIVKWWISHQNNSLNSFTSGTVSSS